MEGDLEEAWHYPALFMGIRDGKWRLREGMGVLDGREDRDSWEGKEEGSREGICEGLAAAEFGEGDGSGDGYVERVGDWG